MGKLGNNGRKIIGGEMRVHRGRRLERVNHIQPQQSRLVMNHNQPQQSRLSMNHELFNNIYNEGRSSVYANDLPKIKKDEQKIDVSIIIPIKGRVSQLQTSLYFLQREISRSSLVIKIVVVENDTSPLNKDNSERLNVDYIFIKGNTFNKCLCHNIGSFLHNSDYVMFHDVDLVVPELFFKNLFENLKQKKALQCFHNRRVIYLDQSLSEIVNREKSISGINLSDPRVREGKVGAPGGSLIIERNLFEKIGGFDPNFFCGYSIEDGFFWKKLEVFTSVSGCDNPIIEMLHLWHEPLHSTNPNIRRDHVIYDLFVNFNEDQKISFLNIASIDYKELEKKCT
jgi:hypothetical protein